MISTPRVLQPRENDFGSPFYENRKKDFRSHLLVAAIALLMAPNGFAGAPMAAATDTACQAAPQTPAAVPSDLKPLLAARTSEMRLVVLRHDLDRTTISCNYANGGGRGVRAPAGPAADAAGGGRNGGARGIPESCPRSCRCRRAGSPA